MIQQSSVKKWIVPELTVLIKTAPGAAEAILQICKNSSSASESNTHFGYCMKYDSPTECNQSCSELTST